MHIMQVLLCFVLVSYHEILPIAFRVSFMGLGQSYESRDCVSASETTLNNMGNRYMSPMGTHDIDGLMQNRHYSIALAME